MASSGFRRSVQANIALAMSVPLLAGCMTPAARIDQRAAADSLSREVIHGEPFRHLTYFRPGRREGDRVLHVYIEHDGTPWLSGRFVAADPTPRQPLMLDLMRLDFRPVLYLGRPCYFELERAPPCGPLLWTHRRYGVEVVDSMATALRRFLATRPHDQLVFVGHSGGGTLAVLLAERFPTTLAVVTIGANLDVDTWASLHDYTPLRGSLNPADRPALPAGVVQRHYVGTEDRNVPPVLVHAYASSHPGAEVIEIAGFDHTCCWRDQWPSLLAELHQHLSPP